jgi:hypothetical protein
VEEITQIEAVLVMREGRMKWETHHALGACCKHTELKWELLKFSGHFG